MARLFFLPAARRALAVHRRARTSAATLTADQGSSPATTYFSCGNTGAILDNCSSSTALTEDEFTHGGTTYAVVEMYWRSNANRLHFQISSSGTNLSGQAIKTALSSLTLNVDGTALAISAAAAASSFIYWSYDPAADWTNGRKVSLSLTSSDTPPAAPTNLSVTPQDKSLGVTWTASTGAIGYDVHYTSAPASGNGAVANSATASAMARKLPPGDERTRRRGIRGVRRLQTPHDHTRIPRCIGSDHSSVDVARLMERTSAPRLQTTAQPGGS